jgi:4,5:9,10-diseco-3-hydroxy-5,9,17-trioxoandrosta-1(10),2-diene-4-oate hydrolase
MTEIAREALGAIPPHKEIDIDGVKLAYNDDGAGPVILCLHAIGHGASDFARVSQVLRNRYRVIALDWPGQGRSGPDNEAASAGRYAELLEKFITALQLDRIVILGNSIGGAAAIRYTADNLQHVRGLVLCNPGGLDKGGRAAVIFCRMMARFFGAGVRGSKWFAKAFNAYYKRVLPSSEAFAQRAKIVLAGYETAPILEQAWMSFADAQADLKPLIPQIRCPVQFCWAMRDRFVPLARSKYAVAKFANARVEKFPTAGHAAFLEDFAHFQHVFERFLDGLR